MRRSLLAAATAIATVVLAGCGSQTTRPASPVRAPTPLVVSPAASCSIGARAGTMGCSLAASIPHAHELEQTPAGVKLPDVSEYQGCPRWQHGTPGVIFRVYEAATGRQDRSAACNASRLRQQAIWDAAYAFLRPGSCSREADRTVAIVHAIGGVTGPVIADAEVPLPAGFVGCFDARVARDTGNHAQVDYSSPGTHPSGNPLTRPLWVATYGPRAGCVAGVCAHVAWQYTDNGCAYGVCGDLSLATGILAIHQHPAPSPAAKFTRTLRHDIAGRQALITRSEYLIKRWQNRLRAQH